MTNASKGEGIASYPARSSYFVFISSPLFAVRVCFFTVVDFPPL